MRDHGGDGQHHDLKCLAARPAGGCLVVTFLEGRNDISELIHAGDRAVEAQAFQIIGEGGKGAVDGAVERHGRLIERGHGCAHGAQGFEVAGDQTPEALGETPGAFGTGVGPLHIALGRAVGQDEPAGGISTIFLDDRGGVDHIAFRFRHGFDGTDGDEFAGFDMDGGAVGEFYFLGEEPATVFAFIGLVRHHALREEARKRLRYTQMAGAGHGAGEVARIEKMEDRVFDAACVLVNRQPVIDGGTVCRLGRFGRAEAGEIPA